MKVLNVNIYFFFIITSTKIAVMDGKGIDKCFFFSQKSHGKLLDSEIVCPKSLYKKLQTFTKDFIN